MTASGSLWLRFAGGVLPILFVGLVTVVTGGLWATYTTVQKMSINQDAQDKQVEFLRSEVASIRAEMVTRKELAATIDAMGQRFEIAMLRAGLRPGSVRVGKE